MKGLFFFIFGLAVAIKSNGQVVHVERVYDGATFCARFEDKHTEMVRVYGIDCPNIGQHFGYTAKGLTSRLIYDRDVVLIKMGVDSFGRMVALVLLNGTTQPLEDELLRSGYAWHCSQYDSSFSWQDLEDVARKNKQGLWGAKKYTAPWIWRKACYNIIL